MPEYIIFLLTMMNRIRWLKDHNAKLGKIGFGFVHQIGAIPKTFGFGIASHLDNLKYNGRLKKVETLISHELNVNREIV